MSDDAKQLTLPASEEDIRALKTGDFVEITGVMYTGRDAAHAYLAEKERPDFRKRLAGRFIYHCGPIVKRDGNQWKFVSAGPTTSVREEMYQADVIRIYGLRGVIGKGGMGARTLAACKEFGAVYLHAVGGAGALAAKEVGKVTNVYMLEEFGTPEAFWEIDVVKFPCIVTMDSHGNSLHDDVLKASSKVYETLMGSE